MIRLTIILVLCLVGLAASAQIPEQQVRAVLDDWHQAASVADEPRYFGHFAPNGVFMGTDPTERWTVAEFRKWAKPQFQRKSAWSFKPRAAYRFFRRSQNGLVRRDAGYAEPGSVPRNRRPGVAGR